MNKGLAFLVFISSCVSAFCLCMLAITYATGSLPFNIQPQKVEEKKKLTMADLDDQPGPRQRLAEGVLRDFYKRLEREKAKIAEERENLDNEKKLLQEERKSIEDIEKREKELETKVKQQIEKIRQDDVRRMTKLAQLIGGMDVADATTMLMTFDDDMASKIMYLMKPKTASKIISAVIKLNDPAKVKRIKKIADDMAKLSEEQKK